MAAGIAFAAAILSTAGCATLFNGFSQRIEVTSEPPGAEVFVGGELAGTTPTEVVVSRRASEREFRVVNASGNSEYRWVRSRMSDSALSSSRGIERFDSHMSDPPIVRAFLPFARRARGKSRQIRVCLSGGVS